MSKLKIAFLVNQFPSLSETFILNQATGLIDLGHEVHIFADRPTQLTQPHPEVIEYGLDKATHYYPSASNSKLLRVINFPFVFPSKLLTYPDLATRSLNFLKFGKQAASLRLFYRAIPFLEFHNFDVIHCHFGTLGIEGLLLRQLDVLQGKLVTSFHGIDISKVVEVFGIDMYKPLFSEGDAFLPISNRWRDRLTALGCPAAKIKVHRMGVDCDKFKFRPRSIEHAQKIRLVSVARLVEKKGIEYGIKAIAKLKQSDRLVEYSIVGDGPLRAELESLVESLGLAANVHFLGSKTHAELLKILDDSHVLLLPSVTSSTGDREGIPVSGMEAMAMGMPVVATHHSGIPELVEDDVTGFLVPERDSEALALKLACLMENPHLLKDFGIAGRQVVENRYNVRKLSASLVDVYTGLMN